MKTRNHSQGDLYQITGRDRLKTPCDRCYFYFYTMYAPDTVVDLVQNNQTLTLTKEGVVVLLTDKEGGLRWDRRHCRKCPRWCEGYKGTMEDIKVLVKNKKGRHEIMGYSKNSEEALMEHWMCPKHKDFIYDDEYKDEFV